MASSAAIGVNCQIAFLDTDAAALKLRDKREKVKASAVRVSKA